MPLRSSFLALCAVFAACSPLFCSAANAQTKRRGYSLASRSFTLRLNLPRVSTVRVQRAPQVRLAALPVSAAPRRVIYDAPVAKAAPNSIALGAYVWQDGQTAPGDSGAVAAWHSRAGRLPAVWLIYQSWTGWNQFPVEPARRARQLGGKLLITWEPWSGQVHDPNWSCARVAGGAYDTYIRTYARAVRNSRVPVMIRFAHEMNGDWYPWGTAYSSLSRRNNGNSPQHYVAMWRRVVDIFRQEGAHNATWVWSPNILYWNHANSLEDQNSDLRVLYPGHDYVDWIGLSVYNDASRRPWQTFSTLFDAAYHTVTRISPRPLMVAEMGVTEVGAPSGTNKAAWISQTLLNEIPTRYPRVRLVNWFCRDKTAFGEADYRFDSSPASLRAFRVAVNSPLYRGQLAGR
ncbi:MAG: hypothetical protein KY445_12380 [Armatimonadetes bacterium]|nr:hypothetical protein [Armatimonadota bacterium]